VIAATASEAPHVLDSLLYHQTGLQIEEHYTDTGGATDHVFGLCHLFGFRFAPCIRDLKDRRLYVFPHATQPPRLQPIIAGTVNVEHIKAHWEELLRMAVSIRSGTSTASAMLKRLSAYPRQNGLAVALREIGRIERSLFTMDWLKSPELRRRAHAGPQQGRGSQCTCPCHLLSQSRRAARPHFREPVLPRVRPLKWAPDFGPVVKV
jgi:TnpA family transposase